MIQYEHHLKHGQSYWVRQKLQKEHIERKNTSIHLAMDCTVSFPLILDSQ